MDEKDSFASVAVALPVNKAFIYKVPERMRAKLKPGCRVFVPFGRRKVTGYVVALSEACELSDVKEIFEMLDEAPSISAELIELAQWASAYYCCPLGEVLKSFLPFGSDMRGYLGVELTSKGRELLSAEKVDPHAHRLLARIGKQGLTLAKDLAKEEGSDIYQSLKKFEGKGLVSLISIVKSTDARSKLIKEVRLSEGFAAGEPRPASLRLGKKGSDIVQYLETRGPTSLSELAARIGSCYDSIRRLARKGILEVNQKEAMRSPDIGLLKGDTIPRKLSPDQFEAVNELTAAIDRGEYRPYLLQGVTGSGKTEVYIQCIAHCLKHGKSAIALVPEISLTPQLAGRFQSRFGSEVAILHSSLSVGERYDEWRRLKEAKAKIAIGARSAVFAPLSDLGIIVVDEEQDASYKQDEGFKYNARDLAIMRAKINRAVALLCSATPSLETIHNTGSGKYSAMALSRRVAGRPMPRVQIIDMRSDEKPASPEGAYGLFSKQLLDAIPQRLSRSEQTMIFLNRRGHSRFLLCSRCGHVPRCVNCSVSLIYHSSDCKLKCHYCEFEISPFDLCPGCSSPHLRLIGSGTQKAQSAIESLFPGARVVRMDSDTTRLKGAHKEILSGLARGEVDILVGTQMIAKGHDYPNVTLAAIISADHSLNMPDFRASERTFQLLMQVAGRAGRGDTPGEVLIQTYNPEHYSITCAASGDYGQFYSKELQFRKEVNYPPFCKIALIRVSALNRDRAEKISMILAGRLRKILRDDSELLGPAQASVGRVKNFHRWQMMLKWRKLADVRGVFAELSSFQGAFKLGSAKIDFDVDPYNIL